MTKREGGLSVLKVWKIHLSAKAFGVLRSSFFLCNSISQQVSFNSSKMKVIVCLVSLFITTQAVSFFDLILEEWQLFKLQHSKKYPSETEDKFRMKIFMDNKHKIAKHNAKFHKGEVSYELGLNKYADMLHHEFIQTMNGYNKTIRTHLSQGTNEKVPALRGAIFIPPANVKLPDYVNWVEQGAVTPVKDQGSCGSCWSFSATGALEGQTFRKTGALISLSEQNLIDCSSAYGNQGCNGGMMDNAFQYIRDNGGIDTERSYPYEAEDDKCRFKSRNTGATDVGYIDIAEGDEEKLKAAVATAGPVSVAIDASHESFQFYKKGIYNEPDCSSANLDHGVLAVGYGTDENTGQDYWLIKNSWGETWGDKGYIRMARNMNNLCGVATDASYPLV